MGRVVNDLPTFHTTTTTTTTSTTRRESNAHSAVASAKSNRRRRQRQRQQQKCEQVVHLHRNAVVVLILTTVLIGLTQIQALYIQKRTVSTITSRFQVVSSHRKPSHYRLPTDHGTSLDSKHDTSKGSSTVLNAFWRNGDKQQTQDQTVQSQDKDSKSPGFLRGLFRRNGNSDASKKENEDDEKREQAKKFQAAKEKALKEERQRKKERAKKRKEQGTDASIEVSREPSAAKDTPLSLFQKILDNFSFLVGGGRQKEEWVPIFPKTRISPGEMVPVTVAGIDLLAIASTDGRRLYCIENSCPHLGTPFETGTLVRLPVENNSPSSSSSGTASGGKLQQIPPLQNIASTLFTEADVSKILQQDGCEDCIVCPLHQTAFALESGEVRGNWCPYPPVIGPAMGTIKPPTSAATFDIRTRGKNVEVRLNSLITIQTTT